MDASSWRAGVTDADIERQRDAIVGEVAATQPLLGDEEDPAVLYAAYADNPSFLPKLRDFAARYAAIRRSRGDGSCFYRCALFGIGAHYVTAGVVAPPTKGAPPPAAAATAPPPASPVQLQYEALLASVPSRVDTLINAFGYPDVTVPDFADAFVDWLRELGAPGATVETAVVAPLRDGMRGLYLITFVRCLVSLELLSKEEEYLPFVLGLAPHCATIKQFCDTEVEAVNVDADQLQITALCAALGVGARIAYVDAAPGDVCREVVFPEDGRAPAPGAPTIRLLYRPGHYDIAVPK